MLLFKIIFALFMLGSAAGAFHPSPLQQVSHAPPQPTFAPADTSPLFWVPPLRTIWDWQLHTPIDPDADAAVIDIDLFDNSSATVRALHTQGKRVICYVSVGSVEDWRPDAQDFPASVIGNNYSGWPGEKWLDIRRIDLLKPLIEKRFDLCAEKGFDAIEPDNIQAYQEDTGFDLTAADQLKYNRWLADAAHERGLSIGLKNDGDQAAALVEDFDWALSEDCYADGWCDQLEVFSDRGKAVFMTEYTERGIALDDFCPLARQLNFNGLLKRMDLDSWRERCPLNSSEPLRSTK